MSIFLVTDYRFTAQGIKSFVTAEGHEAFSAVNGGRPPSSLRSIRRGNRTPESVEGNSERAGEESFRGERISSLRSDSA
jgi:hypothetical protein